MVGKSECARLVQKHSGLAIGGKIDGDKRYYAQFQRIVDRRAIVCDLAANANGHMRASATGANNPSLKWSFQPQVT